MAPIPDAPADTRIMGIVHDAVRRDLDRVLDVLSAGPHPTGRQRTAIGDHVCWLMAFLRAHHHSEDVGLWPVVRARRPEAAALVDALESDHAGIAPLLDACEAAAGEYRSVPTDAPRRALLDSVGRLRDVLLPHLRLEEDDLLPIVSVAMTDAEWRQLDRRLNVAGKPLAQLGLEGHWLLDGLDPERRHVVVHVVPRVPRFVLVHGFARRYRRQARTCWGPAGRTAYGPAPSARRDIPRSGRIDVIAAAPIDAVWAVVADVTRVGEWSHECRHVEWLGGSTTATPGARFRGTNRAGPWTWRRINEVLAADPPGSFVWRTIPTRRFPDSTIWRIDLEPVDGGTRICQTFDVVRAPPLLARVYANLVPTHRDRRTGLTGDLRRLGRLAEEASRSPSAVA